MTQEVANFFVSEARRNMHQASSINEEDDSLIYNWMPHFTGKSVKQVHLPGDQTFSIDINMSVCQHNL